MILLTIIFSKIFVSFYCITLFTMTTLVHLLYDPIGYNNNKTKNLNPHCALNQKQLKKKRNKHQTAEHQDVRRGEGV